MKNIEWEEAGIECDNENCDWIDASVKIQDYQSVVGKPCPKCGENVMTQGDCDLAQQLLAQIEMINSLPPAAMEAYNKMFGMNEVPEVSVKIHNGITITEKKPCD